MVMDVIRVNVRINKEITEKQNDDLVYELQWGETYTELRDEICMLVEKLGIGKLDGVVEVSVY